MQICWCCSLDLILCWYNCTFDMRGLGSQPQSFTTCSIFIHMSFTTSWPLGAGKFGQSAAIGLVPVPKAQMVQKQMWTYSSAPGKHLNVILFA